MCNRLGYLLKTPMHTEIHSPCLGSQQFARFWSLSLCTLVIHLPDIEESIHLLSFDSHKTHLFISLIV